MPPDEIADEQRRGRVAGACAVASGVLIAAGAIWRQVISADAPDGDAAGLRFFDSHSGELVASSVLRALGLLVLIPAALHLYRATKARNPQETRVVAAMATYGPVALALSGVIEAVALSVISSDFSGRSFGTVKAADDAAQDAVKDASLYVAAFLGLSGVIALGFFLVKGGLDAMRVGLLSRFMGMFAIVLGPAIVLVSPAFVVLPLWVVALGGLFLGVWPRGVPPAWTSGRAMPWRGREGEAALPQAAIDPGGSPNGEVDAVGPGVHPAGESGDEVAAPQGGRRKRKRRQR